MTSDFDERALDETPISYPGYLREVDTSGHTYGTLSYNRKSKCWMIRGEPCVTELAKRLFPGCDGHGRGVARFTAHRRIVGELNWLMLRYPLEIRESDRQRWQEALEEAREYAAHRERALREPEMATPPAERFSGTLLDFQRQGLAFLLAARRCLLADDMGLGKTVQALAFLATTAAYPAIIVAPPHLLRNWQSEIMRFINPDGRLRVHVIRGLKPYPLPDADIYLTHYLLLRGWKEVLPEQGFRTAIFDEIQELRHNGTDKYSAASLLSDSVENCIGLSGTPIYNNGGEIWNVVNILDFHFLGDWESFTREWCYGYNSAIVAKPELLGEHLKREGMMLRRLKGDVLKELAPKRRLVQEIDWDDSVYRELMRPVARQLKLLRSISSPSEVSSINASLSGEVPESQKDNAPSSEGGREVWTNSASPSGEVSRQEQKDQPPLAGLTSIPSLAGREEGVDPSQRAIIEDAICQRTRQATGMAKAPFVAAFVRSLVEAGEKVLLFAHHHAVMDVYKQELKALHPRFITGRETESQKQQAADDFMQGKTDLLCISLRSASGLNLQRASCVVFGELDWSPAVHSQAEDRAHRIGQQDSLLCYYLVCPRGSDRDMQDALGLKVSQFVSLMGDEPPARDDVLRAQSFARERIRKLVQRLQAENASEDEHDQSVASSQLKS